MRFRKGRERFVKTPGNEILRLWLDLKSLLKVGQHLAREGEVNPNTGNPLDPTILRRVAILWVIEHPDEAKPLYEKFENETIPDDDWNLFLLRNAIEHYKLVPQKLAFWIKKQPDKKWYQEDYKYVWLPYLPEGKLELF